MRSWVRIPPSALNLVVLCPAHPCAILIFSLLPCKCEAKTHFPNNELGLSAETVLRWIRKKELKAYKLGKKYRVRREDYQEFLDQRYTGKTDDDR